MANREVRRPPAPRLDEGAKNYYKRVEDVLEGGEEGEEVLFLRNVVDQVISDGVRLVCCDKDGSRALERLIQHFSMNTDSIKKLVRAAQPDFFKLCVNSCGSHVMQALLQAASHALLVSPDEDLLQLFLSLACIVEEKVSDYIRHPYASHVLSELLQELGGVRLSEQAGRSRYSREFRKAKMGLSVKRDTPIKMVPDSFVKQLEAISKKVCKFKDLKELLTHQNGGPVVQCLLQVVCQRVPSRGEKLIKKVVKLSRVLGDEGEEGRVLPDIFTDLVGSHVMEAMIHVAPPHLQELIFTTCFRGHVMTTALHPVANFPLQHLIAAAKPSLLSQIFEELHPLEDILYAGHTGVVVKLTEAAVACPDIQPALCEAILQAFHTTSHPDATAPVILALLTYDVFTAEAKGAVDGVEGGGAPHPTSLHGSLLLQALLRFQKVKIVTRSVLKMKAKELVRICCDSHGSHVLTTFMSSSTVPNKKKEKLVSKLEDNLVVLCKDKHGSRVVDTLWRLSQISRKEEMAKVLLAHEEELSADFHGSIVLRNCNIAHFRKKQAGWLEQQRTVEKKKALFQDLLEGGQSPVGDSSSGEKRKRSLKDSSCDERLVTKKKKR